MCSPCRQRRDLPHNTENGNRLQPSVQPSDAKRPRGHRNPEHQRPLNREKSYTS
jgi:hypothetical protein